MPSPDVTIQQLLAETPEAIARVMPMVPWGIQRLWRLDLPVTQLPVQEFDWLLDLPLWQLDGERWQVSPRMVRNDSARFPEHLQRAQGADLSFPIHTVWHLGRLVVLDGFHRLVKASMQGLETIPAMVLSAQDLLSICDVEG